MLIKKGGGRGELWRHWRQDRGERSEPSKARAPVVLLQHSVVFKQHSVVFKQHIRQ